MKKKTYTTEEAVEFLQDTNSYDDSSSEFTESDGSSNIYSSDTTEKEILSSQRVIYQHKQLSNSNKQSLRWRNQNKTKT